MRPRIFLLLGGQLVSQIGTGVTMFCLPWIVLLKTGSAAEMGWLYAAGLVPYLSTTLFAGLLSDRLNRKHLLVATDAMRALVLSVLPITYALHDLNLVWLYAVQILTSVLSACFDSCFFPYIPSIVPAKNLHRVNGLFEFGISAGTLIGPAIAGVLISFIGIQDTLCVDSVSYIVSFLTIMLMDDPGRPEVHGSPSRFWSEIGDGMRFVWANPSVRFLAIMGTVGNLAESAIEALVLFRLRHELGFSAHTSGFIMAGVGLGGLLGALLASWIGNRFRIGNVIMVCLGAVILCPVVLAFSTSPQTIFVAVGLTGVAGVVLNVQKMSAYQTLIPNELMGKSMSTTRLMSWSSLPVGSILGGNVAQRLGTPIVFGITGLLHLSMFVYGLASKTKAMALTHEVEAV